MKIMSNIAMNEDGTYNPYLAARLEWDERYGSQIKTTQKMSSVAIGSIMVALLALCLCAYLTYRVQNVRPYVAIVDADSGRRIAAAEGSNPTREQVQIENALKSFVEDWRLVTPDAELEKRASVRALMMSGSRTSKAHAALLNYWKADTPTDKAARGLSVYASNLRCLRLSDNTYEVSWTETERAPATDAKQTEWKAALTTSIVPPKDKQEAENNALGVFVDDLNWVQTK